MVFYVFIYSHFTLDMYIIISYCRKQIAANTRRLVVSKHAQKVEESSLIVTKLTPDRVGGLSLEKPSIKGISMCQAIAHTCKPLNFLTNSSSVLCKGVLNTFYFSGICAISCRPFV